MTRSGAPTAQLIYLGCPKNQVDSEEILGRLARDGYRLTVSDRRVDVLVINTCGFLQAAKDEGLAVIREAVERRRRGEIGRLVVAGCLVQRFRDELSQIAGIDALVGVGDAEVVAAAARGDCEAVVAFQTATPTAHRWYPGGPRVLSTPPWTAYLKIAEGCDHSCSFCTIPSIRGPYTSKPPKDCVEEARRLADGGVAELNIIAQDTTRYGSDLPGRPDLCELIAQLHAIEGLRWIRVLYAYPGPQLERLAGAMAEFPKLCRYLDVPLQHSDRSVLRAMRRPGDGREYLDMLMRLRERVPGITLRTTLIVGFPGETGEAFENLMGFVQEARFDRLGVFEFSPEAGTPAAQMSGQVPEEERRRRRGRLMELQQGISLERNKGLVGSEIDALIERVTSRGAVGRTEGDAPEVDGSVIIRGCRKAPGSFVRVRVIGADVYDITAREAAGTAFGVGRLSMEANNR